MTPSQGTEVPPVVGIGASAGGFEAFSQLLETLPDDTGMAFVLVQHLDPEHESQLSSLLANRNLMPVTEVENGEEVRPNHIYVIPPDKHLALEDGELRLSPRDGVAEGSHHQNTIDHMMASLADELGPRALGVLLSGTLTDGVVGLKKIRSSGGTTLVQDPSSAKFPDLPRAAIEAGTGDFVLPPGRLGEELGRLARHSYIRDPEPEEEEEEGVEGFEEDTLRDVLGNLVEATGVDFEHYKPTTVQRRIHRRMMATRSETLEDYRELLEGDASELQNLFEEMLILVTEFFRDEETWDLLAEEVLPEILQNHEDGSTVRIWVPGCATGQEAYSVAMLVQEALDDAGPQLDFQVFGTDISQEAIDKAREGLYPRSIESEVPEHRLQRFFTRTEGGYKVQKTLRSHCIFSVHDLTSDPPFSDIDLVSCRNVVIYLDSVLQRRSLSMFHYALNPSGYLVLGSSESPTQASELFKQAIPESSVYEPRAVSSNALNRFAATPQGALTGQLPTPDPQEEVSQQARRSRTDEMLLERYVPASVVVTEDLEIVEYKGSTSRFLEQPSGQATHHLLKQARPEIRSVVGRVMEKAQSRQGEVVRESTRLTMRDEEIELDVVAMPVQAGQSEADRYLVVFEEGQPGTGRVRDTSVLAAFRDRVAAALESDGDAKDERIEELEDELSATQDYIDSLIEDYEAAMEELQSTNEEALSANEELQSTNEELETAKEELQSTNEELVTLNEELEERNDEIERVNNDLRNLLNSVSLPIVMLGPDLAIRRFTPDAEDLLNLRSGDLERPLTDLNLPIDEDELESVMLEVLDELQVQEREIETPDGDTYLLRVQPYRTGDNKVDGVVLVFIDPDRLGVLTEEL